MVSRPAVCLFICNAQQAIHSEEQMWEPTTKLEPKIALFFYSELER